jgi:hypothetical protein
MRCDRLPADQERPWRGHPERQPMFDAKATRKRGAGRMELAKQGHMAVHERIQGLLNDGEARSDLGQVGRAGVLAIDHGG